MVVIRPPTAAIWELFPFCSRAWPVGRPEAPKPDEMAPGKAAPEGKGDGPGERYGPKLHHPGEQEDQRRREVEVAAGKLLVLDKAPARKGVNRSHAGDDGDESKHQDGITG